ncbi:MAG: carbohydrate binding domain-containing protein [gamma proteobacterium symbiont of Bathyaustriella thionipta]|nr:carbohydrate binding domain-containing protein [gamma proteobacterium symbiont of Bathyaustriella thionipta]MCU7950258.1 carbohydrate binding domain-containing protein [gamma proteobacterium symbiont of Bathyaustriella thionipta]MCU7954683.1 carbohydrate binding domain-containing protein [gamma proteobacterium symbiont of Bathyaustriella thionipta]MCU7956820.1 carbohydrate binding domain-containing protein [gamma proteobacterium symbiont of Bathyaustriella thionipta]MCU7965833.1 carbohydrate
MSLIQFTKKIVLSMSIAGTLLVSVQAADAIKTYDLMVLYTADMASSNYANDLDARFAYLEDFTNQTLKNSRVNSQVRIVHTAPAPATYRTLGSAQLDQARSDDTISNLRKKHGADFVVLMGKTSGFCGLGYVPQGDPVTGQLRSYSSRYAYSLVSFACGGATFAHELGHNLSLGHSVKQNSKGGVWPWAIGHGQSGQWVSTMGYNSAYNTRDRLQYFSNPRINECKGDACGLTGKADASKNLNLLASQHVDFMPQVYPSTNNSNTGTTTDSTTGTTTDGTNGSTTVCSKTTLNNNLLQNGDFNALSPWKRARRSTLKIQSETRTCGIDKIMHIVPKRRNRTGISQDVTSLLKTGVDYQFSMKAKLDADSRQNITAYLVIKTKKRRRKYQRIALNSITGSEFTTVKSNFVLRSIKNVKRISLLISSNGKGILLDEVLITSSENNTTGGSPDSTTAGTTTTTNEVLKNDFNNGLQGWKPSFNALVTHNVNGGRDQGGIKISNRTKWYQGIRYDVKGLINSNTPYQFEADVYVEGNNNVILKPYLNRKMTGMAPWANLGNIHVTAGSWQKVKMDINVPEVASAEVLSLYLMGPNPGVNFTLDNIRITNR